MYSGHHQTGQVASCSSEAGLLTSDRAWATLTASNDYGANKP